MNRTHQILMVLFLTFFYFTIQAQKRDSNKLFELHLKVLDSLTGEPLVAATAQVSKHKHYHFTNTNGEVSLDSIKPGLNLVQVTYVGYHPFEKLVEVNSKLSMIVYLCPINFHLHEYTFHSHIEHELQAENQSRIKLSAEQIQRSNAMVFSDLFKQISGVQLLQSGPVIAKPIIRGLHSNRIAIYNNGTKLESQNWGSEHAPEL
ncbi:MAG: TonB-dependent receptor plug domain-containing protein, partial [Bacteroidia bacterium]